MPTSNIHPIFIDEIIVLLSGIIMDNFTPDEQALIGTFLATLGSLISFNSVYLLYTQAQQQLANQETKDKEKDMEVLKKGLDALQKEMEKYKQNKKD